MSTSDTINEYFGHLINTGKTPGVDPSILQTLSKTAASKYIKEGIPLNQSITKIAQEEKNLNAEHIKRIVEMSNTEVFQHLFKTASNNNKYVHFDIANPNIVLESINKIEKTASYDLSSYQSSPKTQKTFLEKKASINSLADELNTNPCLIRHSNPNKDVLNLDQKLKVVKENLESDLENNTYKMKIAYNELYSAIKEEIGTTPLYNIAQAMTSVSPQLDILEPISQQLVKEKVANFEQLGQVFKKTAGILPNPRHPILYYFSEHVKLANKEKELNLALDIINTQLNSTSVYIKEAAAKGALAGSALGLGYYAFKERDKE